MMHEPTAELYMGPASYSWLLEQLVPIAGAGDANSIRVVIGALADIPLFVNRLKHLAPCPVTGRVTDNEVKIVLGEFGNIWPKSILADGLVNRRDVMARLQRGVI